MDLTIIASLQRIEHYEIAAYGTMVELANALEQQEVADLLGRTLDEEKAQDARLTEVTRSSIMPLALEQEEGEEGEGEEEGEEAEAGDGGAASSRTAAARRPARSAARTASSAKR